MAEIRKEIGDAEPEQEGEVKNDRPTAADLFYEMEADVMRLKRGEVTVREANAISKVRKQQLQLLEAGISLRSLEIDRRTA